MQGTPSTTHDECLYGDDVILDQTIISDPLPAAQMNCPDVITFLVKNKKSPFEYCSRPEFKRACCQTCKRNCSCKTNSPSRSFFLKAALWIFKFFFQVYESVACQDLHPDQCEALSAADCMSTSHQIEGLPVLVACARTCKACSHQELECTAFLCMNGATCNESNSNANSLIEFKCTCQPGYYGQFCELSNSHVYNTQSFFY